MKLARKITLALAVLAFLVVTGLEAFEFRRELARTHADMEHDHLLLARAVGGLVVRVWQLEGEREALAVLDQASRSQSEVRVRWVWPDDARGGFAPIIPAAELANASLRPDGGLSIVTDRPAPGLRVTYLPLKVDGRLGAIEVSESLAAQTRQLRNTLLNIAVATLVLTIVFLIGAMALGRRLVGQPVEQLVGMARRIGQGDLSVRMNLGQRDELDTLANAMNQMGAELGMARERLIAESRARLATLESLRHADRLTTVGKLASGVAHELGTPLNVVSGRARMIASGEAQGPEALECARIIGEQSATMTRIIRQLLDFARRRPPARAPEDLLSLAGHVAALLGPIAAKKGVTLTHEGESATAAVDAGQLQQVLTNLVMNAIHAMNHPGEVRLSVAHERIAPPPDVGAPEGDYLRVDVTDTGTGIPEEVLPRIFEPFFTTKEVGEGTGLGLSVSYGLVRDHGGWIAVDSAPGKGSRFSVYLPRSEQHA